MNRQEQAEKFIDWIHENRAVNYTERQMLSNGFARGELHTITNYIVENMTFNNVEEVIKVLVEYIIDQEPIEAVGLLTKFFQHKSDASKLECSQQEELELEFDEWAETLNRFK